jgi:hypothetical protein
MAIRALRSSHRQLKQPIAELGCSFLGANKWPNNDNSSSGMAFNPGQLALYFQS